MDQSKAIQILCSQFQIITTEYSDADRGAYKLGGDDTYILFGNEDGSSRIVPKYVERLPGILSVSGGTMQAFVTATNAEGNCSWAMLCDFVDIPGLDLQYAVSSQWLFTLVWTQWHASFSEAENTVQMREWDESELRCGELEARYTRDNE